MPWPISAIRGAGTIEFLYENGEFYFIEMNTRLQVEHPVTEAITGIDLVHEQIRVASGGGLSVTQEDIRFHGHAIECRINAEDPRTFAPSPGTITHFHTPGGLGIRVDSGVYSGYQIPPYYDSLIGKLIVHGRNRVECMMRLRRALDEFVVDGIKTTLPLFQDLVSNPDIANGDYDIHWLEQYLAGDESDSCVSMSAMTRPLRARLSNPDRPPAARLCIRRVSDGRKRRRPGNLLGRPETRGIIPLDDFHVSKQPAQDGPPSSRSTSASTPISRRHRRLRRAAAANAPDTWINAPIREAYGELFELGYCHSVEAWRDGRLVGGLYGVALGSAFFGESMFSRETDASKICLVHLVERLRRRGLHAARHPVHHRASQALRRRRRAARQV